MKSGRKIYFKLRGQAKAAKRVRRLCNGDLRSLVRYLSQPQFEGDAQTERILGLAIVAAANRWLHKGEGNNL